MAIVAGVLLSAPAVQAVILRASSADGAPGSVVEIAINFDSGGESVAGILSMYHEASGVDDSIGMVG